MATPSDWSKPTSEPCLILLGDDGELAEIVAADAAHQGARPCPDRTGGQHLPVDQRDRVFDAGNAIDPLGDRFIVLERHVDRLHDEVAVDAEDAGKKLGPKAVHHRHDDDEGRDPEHDAEEGDRGDHRDHRLLAPRAKVAPGDKPLEGRERPRACGLRCGGVVHRGAPNRAATSAIGSVWRSPVLRFLISASPAAAPRGPMMTCQGRPIRSAVANLPPGRWSVSS